MKPVLIHLDVLWGKNKDTEWPDWHVTPHMFDNKDQYAFHLNVYSDMPEYIEHVETIEYWTNFYNSATIQDMMNNKNSWIMVCLNSDKGEDFEVYDGFHRLTAARLAKKEIIVATFDIGRCKQGK